MVELSDVVSERPDAVFVVRTGLESLSEVTPEWMRETGRWVARQLFRKSPTPADAGGMLVLKPNILGGPRVRGETGVFDRNLGEATDPDFVGGLVDVFLELGVPRGGIEIIEGRSALDLQPVLDHTGYSELARSLGVRVTNNSRASYGEDELNWVELKEGVIFKEIPVVRPVNDEGAVLINVAKMRTHPLALTTLSVKNLQGLVAHKYKHFCHEIDSVEKYDPVVRSHFRENLREIVEAGFRRHSAEEPMWDRRDEIYAQRASDSLLALRPLVSLVEGIVGRTGTGYRQAEDMLGNLIVAGANPVHVDAVTTALMGHDPRRINYLKVAHERGFGLIDPAKIETYLLSPEGLGTCHDLSALGALKMGVYLRGDTSKLVFV